MAKMLGVLPLLLVAAVATAEFARKPLMYLSNGAISYGYLQDEEVTEVCEDGVKSISGYFKIDGSSNKNYFFWMFEARNNPESAPTAVWLTGGPGCSSQLALLAENGPCKIDDDGKTTLRNLYSWNEHANIMWVDQPAGVGFSYGDKDDYDHNEAEVADDMYAFLNEMLKSHPEYAKNGLYLFAESYGGHYAPAIASRIVDGMRNDPKNLINLLGLGVGNGLTKPEIQYKYYPSMAVNNTKGIQTVSDQVLASMEAAVPQCIQLIEKCQSSTAICPFAQSFCNAKLVSPYQVTGRNVYDLTKQCEGQLCYDFSDEEQFLQADSTVEALHVAPEAAKWVSCNYNVNADFRADWMKNFDAEVANVLSADVSVLIYAGDLDFICNFMGNKAWTLDLDWDGKQAFNDAKDEPWTVEGLGEVGLLRSGGKLQFLQIYDAGHMAPMDKPEASLAMFNSFLSGTLGSIDEQILVQIE